MNILIGMVLILIYGLLALGYAAYLAKKSNDKI